MKARHGLLPTSCVRHPHVYLVHLFYRAVHARVDWSCLVKYHGDILVSKRKNYSPETFQFKWFKLQMVLAPKLHGSRGSAEGKWLPQKVVILVQPDQTWFDPIFDALVSPKLEKMMQLHELGSS